MFTETFSAVKKTIAPNQNAGTWLNDRHSRLNRTRVLRVNQPESLSELTSLMAQARDLGVPVIPCGGRHAMGSQQFSTDAIALDMRGLNRVLGLDVFAGIIEIQAGITWPEILAYLDCSRPEHGPNAGEHGWSIAQKQSGADDLTIGGSLAANVHGRGLARGPIIEDVESLTVIDPEGRFIKCSRQVHSDLFRLIIGGYGLFGVISSVRLRLVPRQRLERVVRVIDSESLMGKFDDRIANGFLYGDFQFQIDDQSEDFLRRGIFSCYRPVTPDETDAREVPSLKRKDWLNLLHLAHVDKGGGFQAYQEHYLRTDLTQHWSDLQQFSIYVDDYHDKIDRCVGSHFPGSEMITELYVPRGSLPRFLDLAREDLRRLGASVIYGTVRLIEQDSESFLCWAREPWACVIFNLCVEHSPDGLARAGNTFRQLIDRALEFGGSFYLTYHKFARRDQIEAAHPMFTEFLRLKKEQDPAERIQSNWYRHHREMFGGA